MCSYTMRVNGIYNCFIIYILFSFTWTYYTHKNTQLVFACRQLGLNMVELASLNMHGCWQACSCMHVGTDCSWLEQPWTWLLYQVGFYMFWHMRTTPIDLPSCIQYVETWLNNTVIFLPNLFYHVNSVVTGLFSQ